MPDLLSEGYRLMAGRRRCKRTHSFFYMVHHGGLAVASYLGERARRCVLHGWCSEQDEAVLGILRVVAARHNALRGSGAAQLLWYWVPSTLKIAIHPYSSLRYEQSAGPTSKYTCFAKV